MSQATIGNLKYSLSISLTSSNSNKNLTDLSTWGEKGFTFVCIASVIALVDFTNA